MYVLFVCVCVRIGAPDWHVLAVERLERVVKQVAHGASDGRVRDGAERRQPVEHTAHVPPLPDPQQRLHQPKLLVVRRLQKKHEIVQKNIHGAN